MKRRCQGKTYKVDAKSVKYKYASRAKLKLKDMTCKS